MPIVDVDGQQIEFPDDMPAEEISAVLQKQFPPQQVQPTGVLETARQGQQQAADLYTSGQQSLPETLLQGAATGADAINTVSGKALGSLWNLTPDVIQKPIEGLASDAISALSNSPAGDLARFASEKYKGFEQNNPRAARDISALARIGSVMAPFGKIKGVSPVSASLDATGAVAKTAGKAAQYAITPTIAPDLVPLVNRAQDMGFKLRLDQVAPTRVRKTIQKVSQEVPFSGVDVNDAENLSIFNRNLAKTIGQETDNLGPETINNFLESASEKFGSALKGESINIKEGDFGRLDDILSNADLTMTGDLKDIVSKNIDKFKSDVGDNVISGEKLASFRSNLLKRIPSAPAESKAALGEIVDTIDGIIDRSIAPEKSEVLKQARREWRNFRTIEPLLEKSETGQVNPTQLMARVASSPYIKASRSAVGEDDLVDLARIGKQFLPKAGGSDTFQKLALGGTLGASLMNPAAGLQALGGMAANRGYQSLYNQIPSLIKMAAKKGSGSPVFLENKGDEALKSLIKKNTKELPKKQ